MKCKNCPLFGVFLFGFVLFVAACDVVNETSSSTSVTFETFQRSEGEEAAGSKDSFSYDGLAFSLIYVPAKTKLEMVLKAPVWLGETEVSYELWTKVKNWAEDQGYSFGNPGRQGADENEWNNAPAGSSVLHPVSTISWRDAIIWTNALTEYYNAHNGSSEDLLPVYYSDSAYSSVLRVSTHSQTSEASILGSQDNPFIRSSNGFRLPSTIEARLAAGYIQDSNNDGDISDLGEYYPDDYVTGALGPASNPYTYAHLSWYSGNSDGITHEIKTKKPNALGFYDMAGNISEWTHTAYSIDPSYRYYRSGSWKNTTSYLLISFSGMLNSFNANNSMGLRFARSLGDSTVSSISLSSEAATIALSATVTLTATILPENARDKTVLWASSDSSVASVSTAGLVTGLATGTTTITATSLDGTYHASCVVTVQ